MDRYLMRALRARGVDVESALETSAIFYRLHTEYLAQGKPHGGVVVCKQQSYSVGEVMRRLLHLVATRSAEEMRDRIEFLSAWS
jgi:hypothetical protein